jgi:hypothetical protein
LISFEEFEDLIFVEIIGDYLIKFTFEGYFGPIVSLGDY